jgi:signal transduction histidine kinase/CheY-like chemotaxis protein
MGLDNNQMHLDWLQKLNLRPSDLVFESDTYQLKMIFLEPKILYEEHVGVINKAAAQQFLDMSNLISNAIKKYQPDHKIVVVANVSKLKRVSRRARKLLIRDIDQWDAMLGIAFSGAGFLVRAIGYAIVRKVQTLKLSFHMSDDEAIAEAQRLSQESPLAIKMPLSDWPPPSRDTSSFSQLWRENPQVLHLGGKDVRSLHRPHWHYKSEKATAKISFSVLENQVLLVDVNGSVTGKDTESYYPLQDQILKELNVDQIGLILDTRKVTWSDAESRKVGEQYYVENQQTYPFIVLIASTFIRFIVKSFNFMSRHKFDNCRLADSVEQAYEILLGEQVKDLNLYEEVARDDPHPVLSELNQIILEQKDIIRQYQRHMDLLIQNITHSSWENILQPAPIDVEKNDLFSDVYAAIELMQRDYLELIAESEQATKKAKEANRLKSLFLARMSHDLRTPLNGILGFSELLLDTPQNPGEKQDLKMIHSSAEQLKLLINDLLEISSIEAGATKISLGPANLSDLLNEISRSHQKLAEKKGLSLEIQIDEKLPRLIQTDINRIRQICSNLITNAIKYTARGKIYLKARYEEHDIDQNSDFNLIIEVIDTGRGVPKKMHQAIFDPFRQVEETKLHPTEGKGLGLAICKHLVHALKGQIKIESVEGQGSLFRVLLPMHIINNELPVLNNATQKFSGRVLLVEDDNVNQMILERMLDKLGLVTAKASNGKEALKLLKSDTQQFSIILMDCQMPHMDGWQTTQVIRNELKLKLPILAITAYAQQEDIQRSLEIGMDDYLVKPLKIKDLEDKLAKYLTLSS